MTLGEPGPVSHVRDMVHDVYVGRGSPWGNPFRASEHGRAEAIRLFEEYLDANPYLLARLPELRGKTLGCYCHPLPCHADVLARRANA